jgi:hypothetical protein
MALFSKVNSLWTAQLSLIGPGEVSFYLLFITVWGEKQKRLP